MSVTVREGMVSDVSGPWEYDHSPLRVVQEMRNWSHAESAGAMGCAVSTWQRYVAGLEAPRVDDLVRFANAADVSPAIFFRKRK